MAKKAEQALIYVLIPVLFCIVFALPLSAVYLLVPMIAALYYLYLKFSVFLPAAIIAVFSVISLLLNFDRTMFISLPLLIAGFVSAILTVRLCSDYRLGCAVNGAALIAAAVIPFMLWGAVTGKGGDELVREYIENGENNVVVTFFSELNYERDLKKEERLSRGDEGFTKAALRYYSQKAQEEASRYLLYYLTSFGALSGVGAYLICLLLKRRTRAGPYAGPIKVRLRFRNMRLDRKYLLICFLPALVFSVLGFFEALTPLTATVFNLLVTVPCAFAGFTLLLYAAGLFKGRAKVAAYSVCAGLGLICFTFPLATLILSMVGIGDSAVPLRPLMDLAA